MPHLTKLTNLPKLTALQLSLQMWEYMDNFGVDKDKALAVLSASSGVDYTDLLGSCFYCEFAAAETEYGTKITDCYLCPAKGLWSEEGDTSSHFACLDTGTAYALWNDEAETAPMVDLCQRTLARYIENNPKEFNPQLTGQVA